MLFEVKFTPGDGLKDAWDLYYNGDHVMCFHTEAAALFARDWLNPARSGCRDATEMARLLRTRGDGGYVGPMVVNRQIREMELDCTYSKGIPDVNVRKCRYLSEEGKDSKGFCLNIVNQTVILTEDEAAAVLAVLKKRLKK